MTGQKEDIEDHHRTYILTFDLGPKIRLLRTEGLKTPDQNDPFFLELKDEIERRIQGFFPDATIKSVTTEDLADEIMSQAVHQKTLLREAEIVSTCLELAILRRGHSIEINRIVDQAGQIIGLGPRPSYPCLDEQIHSINAVSNSRPLVLVEDGSFTGSTLIHILDKLEGQRMSVAAIVIGFAFPKALEAVQARFEGEVVVVEPMEEFIDWMPDHDFFPFTPNCGRVLGMSWNGTNLPFYTHNGASYAVPYLIPFCPMTRWTSIPEDYIYDFSMFCLQQTLKLFELIGRLSGEPVTIGQLMDVRPKISIPVPIGGSGLPRLNARVVDFLSDVCHELA
ncbi:MAG TPA: hypothetical protein VJB67_03265 [Patescibacteria group bacterium]|nr:hypothetical protein [Patescibacteria group bacterium]